jgi:hypothetical protein
MVGTDECADSCARPGETPAVSAVRGRTRARASRPRPEKETWVCMGGSGRKSGEGLGTVGLDHDRTDIAHGSDRAGWSEEDSAGGNGTKAAPVERGRALLYDGW